MVGIVVIAHGGLAEALVSAVRMIRGEISDGLIYLDVDGQDPADVIAPRIERALRDAEASEGVLICTDMFGGTPANVALSYLEPGKVEVLTGVNLPMLLKVIEDRANLSLDELARRAQESARENIMMAGALLKP